MDIYSKKSKWKLVLLLAAALIVAASLWYTNILAKDIAAEERKKVELIANAYEHINRSDGSGDITFLLEVIMKNKSVPVILANEKGEIVAYKNLDSLRSQKPAYLKKQLEQMKASREPIKIEIDEEQYDLIYYKDSNLLRQLKYYPFFQFGIIGIFLLVAYLAFSTARKAEQNQVWVGMAKETAHQIGTPLSSLIAWMEHLKSSDSGDEKTAKILAEMENDVKRFELIAERFSKIGSLPDLQACDLHEQIERSIQYVRRRASNKVDFSVSVKGESPVMARINPQLFDWVIENLLKNALDAMGGKGGIAAELSRERNKVIIDIKDSGKGIPKSKYTTVFQPGYSTKKRGWGLGLSLSKRIIESYHSGRIFVKESTMGKGTTFRIVLPKA